MGAALCRPPDHNRGYGKGGRLKQELSPRERARSYEVPALSGITRSSLQGTGANNIPFQVADQLTRLGTSPRCATSTQLYLPDIRSREIKRTNGNVL